ncbi:PH domain-containing protein [Candidatus Micrarchaeota archaeon]|nr:PH domain-containing protein [Candidatus Micrarchaeota archaeon]
MLSFLWSGWLIKTYEYEITNKNVYFRGGILLKKQSIVPFFKITNLPNTQAVLDQILGITTIGVQTAGTGGVALAEITFEGITNPDEVTELLKMQIEKSRKSSVRTGSE